MANTVTAKTVSAVELFKKSYGLVRENLNVYALVYAVPAALMIAGVIQIISDNQRHGWDWGHVFSTTFLGPGVGSDSDIQVASAIFSFVLFLAAIISYFLAIILNLRVSEGKSPKLSGIWKEYIKNWLWAKLMGLVILNVLILIVGFVLLIVPGIILLWRLFFAPYILVDKNTKVMDALSLSWNMTKGYAWAVYSIILFSIVLAIPGVVPIVGSLLSFVLATAYAVAPALRYQEVKKA